MNQNEKEKEFLKGIGQKVFMRLKDQFEKFSGLKLSEEREKLLLAELKLSEKEFFDSLDKSYQLASAGPRQDYSRMRHFNKSMDEKLENISRKFLHSGNVWINDGILFDSQIGGLKHIHGSDDVIDVLGSATSLSLGAHNPYVSIFDRLEDAVKIRDNICMAYHPGIRQAFALDKITKLHPNKKVEIVMHCESSGTIANNIAIESAIAFVEKNGGKDVRLLAVDGTWAGAYGPAREGTGFNITAFQDKRAKHLYVERTLPQPTVENKAACMEQLQKRIGDKTLAGIIIEPDIIGDAGIITVDLQLLKEAMELLKKHKLPIIVDCVQQLGRTGGYWGENVETILKDYPHLIITTAKSASNGMPFSYTLMPKEIADSAYPVSHVTTNQFNGPLLRAIAVAEMLINADFQKWIRQKSEKIDEIAARHGVSLGLNGLRGKYLNRGIYVGSNENVKLAQIALLVEDGILVGALPQSLRYQPMLLEYSTTNELVAEIIFKRVNEVMKGNVSPEVKKIHEKMTGKSSGLARD